METSHSKVLEEEFKEILFILEKLVRQSNAKVALLIDKSGQIIAKHGSTKGIDTTSLISLSASSIATSEGLAKIIGKKEFSLLFHEGENDNIYMSVIAGRVILIVIGMDNSSLGLIRIRAQETVKRLDSIIRKIFEIIKNDQSKYIDVPFTQVTDEDIEGIFKF